MKKFMLGLTLVLFMVGCASPTQLTNEPSTPTQIITVTFVPTATALPTQRPGCFVTPNFGYPVFVEVKETRYFNYISHNGTIWSTGVHCFGPGDFESINEMPQLHLYGDPEVHYSFDAEPYDTDIVGPEGFIAEFSNGQLNIRMSEELTYVFEFKDNGDIKFSGGKTIECTAGGNHERKPLLQNEWNVIPRTDKYIFILCAAENWNLVLNFHSEDK